MTNKEAKDYLLNVSYMIGTTAVEYMTQKDGDKIREAIEALTVSSAEPERETGKWIDTDNYYMRWKCSLCGCHTRDAHPAFCPYCGAKMEDEG